MLNFFFVCITCLCSGLTAHEAVQVKTFEGPAITQHLDEIARLNNQIYREYPYLYNGEDAEYSSYLKSYAQTENSLVCIAYDHGKAVGLAAAMPLAKSRDFYSTPFSENGYNVQQIFYLGEFGLAPQFQGHGITDAMYQKIQDFAKAKGYETVSLWELNNPSPTQKPAGYIPREDFWKKLGFIQHPELNFTISWTNINETEESPHKAIYWLKKL